MTDDHLAALLAAADPMPQDRAAALDITGPQRDLLEQILQEGRASATGRRSRLLRPLLTIAVASLLAAVAIAAITQTGGQDSSGTAWAAEQIRFAETSPLVLLDKPGWSAEYANELSAAEGEIRFRFGKEAPANTSDRLLSLDPDLAELHWRSGELNRWMRSRDASSVKKTRLPVLGTTAHVYQYEEYDDGLPGLHRITALFPYDGRVLEFKALATDFAAFAELLGALKRVDADTWLSALPKSAIPVTGRAREVEEMLRDIQLPRGFDPAAISAEGVTQDRYQLGAVVTGKVACTWLVSWQRARRFGDRSAERTAAAALRSVAASAILKEIDPEGDWPEAMRQAVAAILDRAPFPSGGARVPVFEQVYAGLGCPEEIGPMPTYLR